MSAEGAGHSRVLEPPVVMRLFPVCAGTSRNPRKLYCSRYTAVESGATPHHAWRQSNVSEGFADTSFVAALLLVVCHRTLLLSYSIIVALSSCENAPFCLCLPRSRHMFVTSVMRIYLYKYECTQHVLQYRCLRPPCTCSHGTPNTRSYYYCVTLALVIMLMS